MATEYTITYTFKGQGNNHGTRSVAFSKFTASGDTGRHIGQITSIQYVHYHTSTRPMTWNLQGRLIFSDGTSITSPVVGNGISGNIVKFVNTFDTLPTAEQFATLTSVQTLDSQGKTTSGGYSAELYWRADSSHPMELIVTFIEEPPVVYAPSIESFIVQRCNSDAVLNDEGQYIATTLKLAIKDSSGLAGAQCRIYYSADTYPEVGVSQYVDVAAKVSMSTLVFSGVGRNTSILSGVWGLGYQWHFAVVFVTGEETAIATATVARGTVSLHISGEPGGGAAVGGFSTGTSLNPKFESFVPAHFYGGIAGLTGYSAGEVKTSYTWIDGKPIYRYVLIATTTISGKAAVIGTLPSAYETMINMHGIMQTVGDSVRPIPYSYYGSLGWSSCYYVGSDRSVNLQLGSSYSGTQKVTIVFEYTKP